MSTPYRDPAAMPRFICIVCYRWMASHPRTCRDCHVEMNDLSDPQVRETVRQEAEKRLQRGVYREWSTLVLVSGVLVSPLVLIASGYALLLSVPLSALLARGYTAVKKKSAIATFASRRRRISAELGVDIQVDEVPDGARRSDLDPLQLEMEPLLAWLGTRMDPGG